MTPSVEQPLQTPQHLVSGSSFPNDMLHWGSAPIQQTKNFTFRGAGRQDGKLPTLTTSMPVLFFSTGKLLGPKGHFGRLHSISETHSKQGVSKGHKQGTTEF